MARHRCQSIFKRVQYILEMMREHAGPHASMQGITHVQYVYGEFCKTAMLAKLLCLQNWGVVLQTCQFQEQGCLLHRNTHFISPVSGTPNVRDWPMGPRVSEEDQRMRGEKRTKVAWGALEDFFFRFITLGYAQLYWQVEALEDSSKVIIYRDKGLC